MAEFNEINADGEGGKNNDKTGGFFLDIAAAAAIAAVVAIGQQTFLVPDQ